MRVRRWRLAPSRRAAAPCCGPTISRCSPTTIAAALPLPCCTRTRVPAACGMFPDAGREESFAPTSFARRYASRVNSEQSSVMYSAEAKRKTGDDEQSSGAVWQRHANYVLSRSSSLIVDTQVLFEIPRDASQM